MPDDDELTRSCLKFPQKEAKFIAARAHLLHAEKRLIARKKSAMINWIICGKIEKNRTSVKSKKSIKLYSSNFGIFVI